MPEGVHPYPRWNGRLAPSSRVWTVAAGEVERMRRHTWSFLLGLVGLAWGVVSVVEVWQLRRLGGDVHDWDLFLDMLHQLRWAVVAFVAAAGGPAILDDQRLGALELYLTRPLTSRQYVAGKALALVAVTTGIMFLPCILYVLATLGFYDEHPEQWARALPLAFAYSLAWGLATSGVALGLSAVGRSARAMAIAILGLFVGLHVVMRYVLPELTDGQGMRVLSPMQAHEALGTFLFPAGAAVPFDPLWGVVALAVLAAAGWALLALRRPRVRGEA